MKLRVSLIGGLVVYSALAATVLGAEPKVGPWRAWLESPGGELPFRIELERDPRTSSDWRAWIINGEERMHVPKASFFSRLLVLDIDYYNSKIVARVEDSGRLDGEWRRRGRDGTATIMPFHATAGWTSRFLPPGHDAEAAKKAVAGRWSVKFEKSDDPAVGVFEVDDEGVTGTFLTSTGDYRFLAGRFQDGRLQLSGFDGAHAFLFDAKTQPDGTLQGDFWSRDSWHETWTARRDPDASLPDPFKMTQWKDDFPLGNMVFRDPDGQQHALDDPAFAGKARVIEIFGTWCPNCHDATNYLVELHHKYKDQGLVVIGLAFEFTGDFRRDARQVRRYTERHKVDYPMLIAGVANKDQAGDAVPILDKLRAYPTTLFLDEHGKVQAVYTGFSGPATGPAYEKLQAQFESLIKRLLGK